MSGHTRLPFPFPIAPADDALRCILLQMTAGQLLFCRRPANWTMNSNLAALKRARTDDQKAARRRAIKQAAAGV